MKMHTPALITCPALSPLPHGFFGREGGVSVGAYASLNVGTGSDDDPAALATNRQRIVEAVLPNASLATVYQTHSARVVTVDTPFPLDQRPEADAMVTANPAILLGILTADCVPVLFADHQAKVVGAAHAGWKGAINGVTDNTIEAMERLGARRERIVAVLGPCIARASYEVSAAFITPFIEQSPAHEQFFMESVKPDHYQFDIAGYVLARLAAKGVQQAIWVGEDTYPQEQRYFSYRRACHRQEPVYGRQMSVIGIG